MARERDGVQDGPAPLLAPPPPLHPSALLATASIRGQGRKSRSEGDKAPKKQGS